MDLSLFLARVIGVYFIIMAIFYLARPSLIRSVISDFYDSPALVVFASAWNLIVGLLMVVSHSIWAFSWVGLVTLVGYIIFAKGVANLFFPSWAAGWSSRFTEGRSYVYSAFFTLAAGVFLVYFGFFE